MIINYKPLKAEEFQAALDKHNIDVSTGEDDALSILCGLVSGLLDSNAELANRLEKIEVKHEQN